MLNCMACGSAVAAKRLAPLMRCPACGVLGYPDRAGQHLITLAWVCPSCDASNDGLHNFCLGCGAGLTSRCIRCSSPVYGALCLACGTHQARTQVFEDERHYRATRDTERRVTRPRTQGRPAGRSTPLDWRELDKRWQRAARRRAKRWQKHQYGLLVWIGLLLLVGLVWHLAGGWTAAIWGAGAVLWGASPGAVRRWAAFLLIGAAGLWVGVQHLSSASEALWGMRVLAGWAATTLWPSIWATIGVWWVRFVDSLSLLPVLKTNNPTYAALFGTVLFSLVTLPIGIFMIEQLVRRWFRD